MSGRRQHCTSRVRSRQDPVDCCIDKLQDELLVAILSYLSVKEAATTSLVSHRWRYLWQYTTGCLEIYDRDGRTAVPEVAREFIKLVNQVLKLHQGPTLEQLRVGYKFVGSCFSMDHWIKCAIQKEVKSFELNLAAGYRNVVGWSYYYFPAFEKRASSVDTSTPKFSKFCCNLKSLSLVNVHIREETVHFLLSKCPLLEQIYISGSKLIKNLKVTGQLPRLKSVEISWCSNVKSLEVDAPNLESFTYIGPNILVPFQNVHPQLSELTTGDEYCYYFIFYADEHTSYACGLRKLKLKVPPLVLRRSWNSSVYPSYNIPRLDNLRELELELDLELQAGASLLFFTIFCKASPLLARFTARIRYIQVFDEERIREMADVEHTHCVHNNLKVVKLIGFTGCTSDFELALHLLEIGGSLEEMILQPTNDLHHPKVMKLASIQDWSKQLEAKMPPGAKLVML